MTNGLQASRGDRRLVPRRKHDKPPTRFWLLQTVLAFRQAVHVEEECGLIPELQRPHGQCIASFEIRVYQLADSSIPPTPYPPGCRPAD